MRILILGNINSTFILNYIKELKAKMNCEIDILTVPIQQKEYVKQFIKYFNNIYEISKNNNSRINRIPKIRGLLQIKSIANKINKLGNYDICHIHFLNKDYGFLTPQITSKCKKLVISIWGSDFYRSKWWEKKIQHRIIKCAHKITFTNKKTLEEFDKDFKITKDKYKIVRFGLAPLKILKNIENISKEECKVLFNIPIDALVVTCGYHAGKIHQHIEIIKSIENIKYKLPSNMCFLFPFTYGLNREYFLKVKNLLDKSNLNYRILTNFLSDYEVAILRKASDIMINVPKSDQLSGSMQESLYAENIVIIGSWLPYNIFYENGISMLKVNNLNDIGNKLIYILQNIDNLRFKNANNKYKIWELSSWDNNIDNWIKMYIELLQN